MKPVRYDIEVKQGATWTRTFTLTDKLTGLPVPILEGWLGRGQFRGTYNGAVTASLTIEILDYPGGVFKVTKAATALVGQVYNVRPGQKAKNVWDVELYDPEDQTQVESPLYGEVAIIPEVTRAA